jgi:putative Ca2+/H+ antiporter (TMEM165/GDT1 family)
MRKVVRGTMSTVLICCTIVGVFGYITFANNLSIFEVHDVGGVVLYAYAYDENENFTSPPTAIRIVIFVYLDYL